MRLAITLILFSLSAFHLVAALNRHPNHRDHHSRSIALRQHHEPRTLFDVCAYLDVDLLGDSSILGLSLGELHIDVCLCLSGLPLYLATDINVLAIIEFLGEKEVAALLGALINTAPTSKECSYPSHSTPICSLEDVCGFKCEDHFIRKDRECVCESPNTQCNGRCDLFPQGCGSAVPRSLAERRATSHFRGTRAINQQSQAQETCRFGEQVCGTYGGPRGFECLNVKTNLESCGGCTIPNPFLDETGQIRGVDCSSLPGVDDVVCSLGACAVRHCKDGWIVSKQGDTCEQISSSANSGLILQTGPAIAQWRSFKRMKKGQISSRSSN